MKSRKEFASLKHMAIKALIFVLAVSNFIFIWNHQKIATTTTISFCGYCPWYDTWSYTNAPSLLILAAFLLLFSRWWSYLGAIALGGGLTVYIIFYLVRTIANFGLSETLKGLLESEPGVLLIWEIQLVWAGIILIFALYYFLRERRLGMLGEHQR